MKPWKSTTALALATNTNKLQWGHGDEAVEEPAIVITLPVLYWLQWGHGDEAVEEGATLSHGTQRGPASMGPRR